MIKYSCFLAFLLCFPPSLFSQNNTPKVTNVTFEQRTDGSFFVDIYYDLFDADGDDMTVSMEVSDDAGQTYDLSATLLTGDVGEGITNGTSKHIVWDFGAEHPYYFSDQIKVKIIADDGYNETIGLVAYYPFNGNANDESSNSNDGTVNGASLTFDRFGNENSAFSFDGVNDFINVPYNGKFDLLTGFTLSTWVKVQGNSTYGSIISKGGSNISGEPHVYFLRIRPGQDIPDPSKFQIFIMDDGGISNQNEHFLASQSEYLLNIWTHVTATYDASKLRIFINGDLDSESELIGELILQNDYDLEIGRRFGDGSNCFQGIIDDIRIYNYALTETEIAELCNENGWTGGGECGDPITYAGKTYNTVQIGNQCWLKENLNVGIRINGTNGMTENSTIEKYCYDDNPANCEVYGGLYQWDEVMQYVTIEGAQGICPDGWHIPTNAEYKTLETYAEDQAAKLVDTSQNTSSYSATNETGFSSLFAGYRNYDNGNYSYINNRTAYWSSTDYNSSRANYMSLNSNLTTINFNNNYKDYGFSIRCVHN